MMDNIGLIDSIIVDLNAAIGALHTGQSILFCSMIGGIGQKLAALKKGVQDDEKSKDISIETLKAQLRALSNNDGQGDDL